MSASRIARRRRRREGAAALASSGARRGRKFGLFAGILIGLGIFSVATAGAAAIYGMTKYSEFASEVQPAEELLEELPQGGARIYDRHGVLLYEFVDELGGLRRPVPLSEISPWLIDATVATEDNSFWTNNGLNVAGLARAAWENFSPLEGGFLEGSGGSSITQQLAKNVYIPREERTQRSPERKLKEAVIALELTEQYSKEQILEWYLNSIPYGGIYVGVEAAAQGYFGKEAKDLTLAEAALLAGIPQQPAAYDPFQNPVLAEARQNEVLDLMVRNGSISAEEADRARNEELVFQQSRFEILAPHFVLGRVADEIKARFGERALYEDGLEVVTSIDLELQNEAQRILEGWIREYEGPSGGHNGAFYVLDPHTGEILVYVGSRDYFRDDIAGRNDNIVSLNSPGSTLKPFTFMTAFMQGWSTGTGILDTPTQIVDAGSGETFTPRNPGTGFQGIIPADEALGNSLNVTALKAIIFAGVPQTINVLKQVGFTTLDNPGGYGPALTLGGVDVTLQDLVYGYSTFATGGVMRGQDTLYEYDAGERTLDPVAILRVSDPMGEVLYEYTNPVERRVLPESYPYLVTSILSDGSNQCITFGACNALGLPDGRPSAQKTGTSEPYANDLRQIGETWAVGYTPHLVAGVWFGNADNTPMVNILSTSVSWRAYRDFMDVAHDYLDLPPDPFVRPSTVVERELCWPSGKLPTEACPEARRYSGLFAQETLARATEGDENSPMFDTWWQSVDIDVRTGSMATPATPPQFVENEVRLVLPEDEIRGWGGLREWASRNGLAGMIGPAGDAIDTTNHVAITSPNADSTVSGQVPIVGRAGSPNFQNYAVEWGRGRNPNSWVRIQTVNQPRSNTTLTTWDTMQIPDGEYMIRVLVEDEERGQLRFQIPVRVANGEGSVQPSDDLSPLVEITSPASGASVSGGVTIDGSAVAVELEQMFVEVGPGPNPTQWTRIAGGANSLYNQRLASWDSTTVEDGVYTIRVVVLDRTYGQAQATSTIVVANGSSDDSDSD